MKNDFTNDNTDYSIPEDAESIVSIQDGDEVLLFGFKSHRQLFSQLGYMVIPADDTLSECTKVLCDMLRMTPLLEAMTLSPDDLLAALDEETKNDPDCGKRAAMALTAAKQAVIKYANDAIGNDK